MFHVKTLEAYFSGRLTDRSFALALLGLLGGLALVLAAVGLYGVISYSVARRTREIGVRMALGAVRRDVVRLVVRQALVPLAAGLGIGLAAALVLTRWLATLLFEVTPADPATAIGAALLLAAITLAAAFIPARRAATADPISALRTE